MMLACTVVNVYITLANFPHMQALSLLDFLLGVWDERKFRDVSIDSECTNWLKLLLGLVDITRDHSRTLLNKFLGKTGICKRYRRFIHEQVRTYSDMLFTHLLFRARIFVMN